MPGRKVVHVFRWIVRQTNIEAAFLYYAGRKNKLSLMHAAMLSFVMNASSYGLGLAIPAIIFSTLK
jgi:hypothetical protein